MIKCRFENGNDAALRHVVVDTLVLNDGKILLVKRAESLLEGGKWGLVGGYVDRDETIKQAVVREVFEETGWKVKDISLLRIIDSPHRPHEDRQNIAFILFCLAEKQEGEADWESVKQEWFPLDSIPPKNSIAFDHASSIAYYLDYLKKPFKLIDL